MRAGTLSTGPAVFARGPRASVVLPRDDSDLAVLPEDVVADVQLPVGILDGRRVRQIENGVT